MVMDALRGYVQLASGLTEVTRQRAQQAAKQLLQQSGAESLTTGLTAKVSDLADEIVATSKSNRALLQAIVANEVEGAVARLGFVRAEEVAALRRRLEKLEQAAAPAAASPASKTTPSKSAAAKTAAKKAQAKKTTATKAASTAAAKKTPAKKTTAKKTAAKSAAAAKA
ncbi:MAG TPA: polyhydroxyalkanoate synthesis protein PhaF [Kribbellaceae bacterium]